MCEHRISIGFFFYFLGFMVKSIRQTMAWLWTILGRAPFMKPGLAQTSV